MNRCFISPYKTIISNGIARSVGIMCSTIRHTESALCGPAASLVLISFWKQGNAPSLFHHTPCYQSTREEWSSLVPRQLSGQNWIHMPTWSWLGSMRLSCRIRDGRQRLAHTRRTIMQCKFGLWMLDAGCWMLLSNTITHELERCLHLGDPDRTLMSPL